MRPLRRKPKEIDIEPTLLTPSSLGLSFSSQRQGHESVSPRPAGTGEGLTDDPSAVVEPDHVSLIVGTELIRQVHEIAAQLFIPRPREDFAVEVGGGSLASRPYSYQSDDLDLDRTIENVAGRSVFEDRDVIVRERVRRRYTVVLLVDVSGSMLGERARTMAATVAALARELIDDKLAVLAFWSDATWVKGLDQPARPFALLDNILRIPAQGLTNIAFPLELARRTLDEARSRSGITILLSDCIHNAGPDPRALAARLSRLHVLVDASGQHDAELGAELSQLGHGRLRLARSHRDVAPAVRAFFAR